MQPGWCQPVRQEFMQNECEALPGVAYPRVRDNHSTLNTKTGYIVLVGDGVCGADEARSEEHGGQRVGMGVGLVGDTTHHSAAAQSGMHR